MGKSWYLAQNIDVKVSGINPVRHFVKYGIKEGRKWIEPSWFKRAFGQKGWIWKSQIFALAELQIDIENQQKYYPKIQIKRIGNYSKEIWALKRVR